MVSIANTRERWGNERFPSGSWWYEDQNGKHHRTRSSLLHPPHHFLCRNVTPKQTKVVKRLNQRQLCLLFKLKSKKERNLLEKWNGERTPDSSLAAQPYALFRSVISVSSSVSLDLSLFLWSVLFVW